VVRGARFLFCSSLVMNSSTLTITPGPTWLVRTSSLSCVASIPDIHTCPSLMASRKRSLLPWLLLCDCIALTPARDAHARALSAADAASAPLEQRTQPAAGNRQPRAVLQAASVLVAGERRSACACAAE